MLNHNQTRTRFKFIVPNICYIKGVQKIHGFSRGWHHRNSIRLGINRSENEQPRFHAYTYIKGKQVTFTLGNLPVGGEYYCELWLTKHNIGAEIRDVNDNIVFSVDHKHKKPIRLCRFGYDLGQYFEIDGTNTESQMIDLDGNEIDVEVWGV